MNSAQIRGVSILVIVLVLMAASFLAVIATIVFRKRMSVETAHILFGLFPLEFCILFFGMCFLFVASFFLSP